MDQRLQHSLKHLNDALAMFYKCASHLLTQGEKIVLDRYATCSEDARALYSALIQRRPLCFRISDVDYSIENQTQLIEELHNAELIHINPPSYPVRWRLQNLQKKHLRQLLSPHVKNLPSSLGKKALIVQLLAKVKLTDLPDIIVMRHKSLYRRIVAEYLWNDDGNMSRLIIASQGLVNYYNYSPGLGGRQHRTRSELRTYQLLWRVYHQNNISLVVLHADKIHQFAQNIRPVNEWRYKRSTFRFTIKLAMQLADYYEHNSQLQEAVVLYDYIQQYKPEALHRKITLLGKLQEYANAVSLFRAYEGSLSKPWLLRIEKTARRIAKKGNISWYPQIPIGPCRKRRLSYVQGANVKNRPQFLVDNQFFSAEAAIITTLRNDNRKAVYTENAPFRMLKSLFFTEEMFLPLDYLLPAPAMHKPLDFDSPAFYRTRKQQIDKKLEIIKSGNAISLLRGKNDLMNMAISGIQGRKLTLSQLTAIVETLTPNQLFEIMKLHLLKPREAMVGMPDILVLPGPSYRLANAYPSLIPSDLFFIEVKTPNDTLSEAQIVWLDRLRNINIHVEVWNLLAK